VNLGLGGRALYPADDAQPRAVRAAGLAVSLALCAACADEPESVRVGDGASEPARCKASALIRAAEDGDAHRAVGALGTLDGGGRFHVLCTATLVAPDRVLTAKHCSALGSSATVWTRRVSFALGRRGSAPEHIVEALEPVAQDDLHEGVGLYGSDVAMYHLAEPITGVTPMRVSSGAAALSVGATVEVLGYGIDESGCALGESDPVRRIGAMTVAALVGNIFDLAYGSHAAFEREAPRVARTSDLAELYGRGALAPTHQALLMPGPDGTQPCHGDSGGPVLYTSALGVAVVGVIAWTWRSPHETCDFGAVIGLVSEQFAHASSAPPSP
jgi:Trypsin